MIFQVKISVEFVDDFVAGENNRYHKKRTAESSWMINKMRIIVG